MHAFSNEIPEVITDQFKVRVIHGEYQGKKPSYQMVTAVKLFHVFLEPNAIIEIEAEEMAFVYGLNGRASIEGVDVKAQTLVNFSSAGNRIVIEASNGGFECMFASGKPHNEPITYGGPFVMTTADQMAEARRLYANGKMGRLDSYQE
jgi:redox-sensitive bicupin YhaK (pirin superfamily)